jgi:predicted tellurium resistance membrane protein TerC
MLDWIGDAQAWIALATLTALEIVLGIDNVVFVSILADRLPHAEQRRARLIGLSLAMFGRIALLLSITWITRLTDDWFAIFGKGFSGRDLILISGGLFLIGKATFEIHAKMEREDHRPVRSATSLAAVVVQILMLDLVFSLDSVITAVGMADHVPVMVAAIAIAVGVMMLSAGAISAFTTRHPTIKMLALSFLLLIGVMLVAEGFDQHIPKGYAYMAMAFSLFVEMLNLRAGRQRGERRARIPLPRAES